MRCKVCSLWLGVGFGLAPWSGHTYGGPNHRASASSSPLTGSFPAHATCPSGRINTASGAGIGPITGSSHAPSYDASLDRTRSPQAADGQAAALAEIEQHRVGIVQQRAHTNRAIGGLQVKIGHATPQQRVLAGVVVADI